MTLGPSIVRALGLDERQARLMTLDTLSIMREHEAMGHVLADLGDLVLEALHEYGHLDHESFAGQLALGVRAHYREALEASPWR